MFLRISRLVNRSGTSLAQSDGAGLVADAGCEQLSAGMFSFWLCAPVGPVGRVVRVLLSVVGHIR